tara:strand:- start:464 stop:913 length:450 start_codon:yes stop_codon:yes gene_type:complete
MKYKRAVELLDKVFEELPDNIELTKGGLGELALAHHLGHELVDGDKGADASFEDKLFEYKVSTTNTFNFHFGTREKMEVYWKDTILNKFSNVAGAYCANRVGMKITEVAYCPCDILVPVLIQHFERTTGQQLNKSFSMNTFRKLTENNS